MIDFSEIHTTKSLNLLFFLFVHLCCLLLYFCVSKWKGMSTKKAEEATYYLHNVWLGIPSVEYMRRFKFILKLIILHH